MFSNQDGLRWCFKSFARRSFVFGSIACGGLTMFCMGYCLWVGTLIMPSASAKTGMFICTIDLAFWLEEAGWNGHEHEYELLFTLIL